MTRTLLAAILAIAAPASAAVVPALATRPESRNKIVLDFDGDAQDDAYGGTPEQITAIWSEWSRPFVDPIVRSLTGELSHQRPLDVDITTVDPGPSNYVVRVVIGDPSDGSTPSVGGYASVGTFGTVFASMFDAHVFPKNLGGDGATRNIGRAGAHETGHVGGLDHQAAPGTAYNPGDADLAPIMGLAYYAEKAVWWIGPTPSGTIQDDYATLEQTFGVVVVPEPANVAVAVVACVCGVLILTLRRRPAR